MSNTDLDTRLERLVDKILAGQCLPFLGAGISLSAPALDCEHGPTLSAARIAERLAIKLLDAMPDPGPVLKGFDELVLRTTRRSPVWSGDPPTSGHKQVRDLNEHLDRNQVPRHTGTAHKDHSTTLLAAIWVAPAEVPSLGEVAELCWAKLGPRATVEVLQFDQWHRFHPTAAHHYLAVLVREGLIDEVLQTNYDDLVERAVWETLDWRQADQGLPRSSEPAPVLHDLGSFSAHIARARRPDIHQNLVRVVKLNGCAVAWKGARDRDEASRHIGLTEEHLQGWADKRWAQDLLQVRTRSASLLFIGFAGADPLVRHHVLAVLREIRNERTTSPGPSHWWDRDNAPFIMEYADNLKFAQFQVLRAYRDAHSGTDDRAATGPADVYQNTFIGTDGPAVRQRVHGADGGSSRTLTADDFLAAVASRAVERVLCERVLSDRSPVSAYLSGTVRSPLNLLSLVRAAITTPVDPSGPSQWATWMLLYKPSTLAQQASAWSVACHALEGNDAGRGAYRPFLDVPVKQPMLLVMMMLARLGTHCRRLPSADELRCACVVDPSTRSALGVTILPHDAMAGQRPVIVTSKVDRALEAWRIGVYQGALPAELVLLALGRGTTVFHEQVRVQVSAETDQGPGTWTVRTVHVIGDLAALRGPDNRTSVSVPVAAYHVRLLARDPSAWTGARLGWRHLCAEVS